MIDRHGDDLERTYFEFGGSLPAYRVNWSLFIGRNGARPAELLARDDQPLSQSDTRVTLRDRVAQYHYSVLEAFTALENLYHNVPVLKGSPGLTQSDVNQFVLLLHLYPGRISDSLQRMIDLFVGKNTRSVAKAINQIDLIAGGRNAIIHGPHPPYWYEEDGSVLIVPPNESSMADGKGWDDKTSFWQSFDSPEQFVRLDEYAKAIYKEVAKLTNSVLGEITELIREYLRKNSIQLAPADRYDLMVMYGRSGGMYPEDEYLPDGRKINWGQ